MDTIPGMFIESGMFLFVPIHKHQLQLTLFFALLIDACTTPGHRMPGHSRYFDSVLVKANNMGVTHVQQTFRFLDSAYEAFPDADAMDLYKKYEFKHRYFYDFKKDYAQAMVYADSQLLVLSANNNQPAYLAAKGKAFFNKGDVLMAQHNYNDAFVQYYRGKQFIEKTADTCLFNEYTGRLATVCFRQARFGEAIRYYRQGLNELLHCRSRDAFSRFVEYQGTLDNIALCYTRMHATDSALHYFDSVLQYIQHTAPAFRQASEKRFAEIAQAVVYGNMGEAYLQKGDTALAEAVYRKDIQINSQDEHPQEDAEFTMAKLARLYLARQRYADAAQVLADLQNSLRRLYSARAALQWRELSWKYYDQTHRTAEAYRFLQSYLQLKDSLAALDKLFSSTDMDREIERISNKYEMNLLKKQNELKTVYLAIAILFLTMSVVIILLIWKNWEKSKDNVQQLTGLNERIIQQNEHLQKTLRALEQSHQDNTRIMKVVAHDLRSPVGAIATISDLLMARKMDAAEQKAMLQVISSSAGDSLELISELLNMQGGTADMPGEHVDMRALLQYCVNLLQHKADEKKQHIRLQAEPVSLKINREKMWRVFSNLLSNAVKFSAPGSTILMTMQVQDNRVLISVEDNGIGIPAIIQSKIFTLSTEIKRTGTAGEPSFGLGLVICKQIVEAHKGNIWFTSEEGKGTAFFVELPRVS